MTVPPVQIWWHRVTQDTAWGAVPVRAAAAMTPTQGEDVPRPVTAWDELTTRPAATPHFLSLGDELIDGALGGGIGPGVTEIWGEEGSGKSHLGLLLALQVQLSVSGCVGSLGFVVTGYACADLLNLGALMAPPCTSAPRDPYVAEYGSLDMGILTFLSRYQLRG